MKYGNNHDLNCVVLVMKMRSWRPFHLGLRQPCSTVLCDSLFLMLISPTSLVIILFVSPHILNIALCFIINWHCLPAKSDIYICLCVIQLITIRKQKALNIISTVTWLIPVANANQSLVLLYSLYPAPLILILCGVNCVPSFWQGTCQQ